MNKTVDHVMNNDHVMPTDENIMKTNENVRLKQEVLRPQMQRLA